MSLVKFAVTGNLRAGLDQELRRVSAALRRAVTTTGQQVQDELRSQARGAGFSDGGRAIANAWRKKVFPAPGVGPTTLKPAVLVWSKMPSVILTLDTAQIIRPKSGERLALPTPFNLKRVRSTGKREPIVSTAKMAQLEQERPARARLAASRRNGNVLIWYIRVNKPSKRSALRGKSWVERKYRFGNIRLSSKGIQRDWVPMFVLLRPYKSRKRLDIAAVRHRAPRWFAQNAVQELSRA